jgi:hypothetical protein
MQQLLMPRQFTHQPMLHWDPPSTSRQEVSASGHAVIRFGSADGEAAAGRIGLKNFAPVSSISIGRGCAGA